MALARWDTEGGAGPNGPQEGIARREVLPDVPPLTNTELVQLRVRVIALENLGSLCSLTHPTANSNMREKWRPTSLHGRALPIMRLPCMLPRIWSILFSEPNIFGLIPTTDSEL